MCLFLEVPLVSPWSAPSHSGLLFGVGFSCLQRFPSKFSNHLTGAAGGFIFPRKPLLGWFYLLCVGNGVWTLRGGRRVFKDRPNHCLVAMNK